MDKITINVLQVSCFAQTYFHLTYVVKMVTAGVQANHVI